MHLQLGQPKLSPDINKYPLREKLHHIENHWSSIGPLGQGLYTILKENVGQIILKFDFKYILYLIIYTVLYSSVYILFPLLNPNFLQNILLRN